MRTFLAFCLLGLLAASPAAAATGELSDAQREARQLVDQLLAQSPAGNSSFHGVLKIRDSHGKRSEVPVKCEVIVTATNWQSTYAATLSTNGNGIVKLTVTHNGALPSAYELTESDTNDSCCTMPEASTNVQTMLPFAGSDFWIGDLGMEFFHWPDQKVLKHEMKRSRSCRVLESTNPNPGKGDYSRVVAWIDHDSGGIVMAEAYDASHKLLKEFTPKVVKDVKGQWQVQEMSISNTQTGARTQLEFDLDSK